MVEQLSASNHAREICASKDFDNMTRREEFRNQSTEPRNCSVGQILRIRTLCFPFGLESHYFL